MGVLHVERQGVMAQAGFRPPNISGLNLWLDATQETAGDGTALVPADRSASARSLSQGVAPALPVLKTNIQNGKSVYRFVSASSAFVIVPGYKPVDSSGASATMFAAVKSSSTAVAELLSLRGSGNGWLWRMNASNVGHGFFWIGGSSQSDTVTTTAWHVIEMKKSGTSVQTGHDGALVSATTFATYTATDLTGLRIGVGAADGGNFFVGDLGELLVYDTALSDPNRALVEAYLKARWATP